MASDFKTIITSVGVTDLQVSPVEWTLVSMKLESGGPVIVGTKPELSPIGSGKGISLGTTPRYFLLAPAERLYTLSGALNTVSMTTHTLPNMLQLIMKLDAVIGSIAKKFGLR